MTNKTTRSQRVIVNVRLPVSCKSHEIELKNAIPNNNGFRPHGGYRGVKGHPPSPYSWDKSEDFHEGVDEEVSRWLDEPQPSPKYALNTSKLQTHSGESPLFLNRLLAPTRLEQNCSVEEYYANGYHKTSGRGKKSRPSSSQLYYRPPSRHEYLTATSRSHSGSDASLDSLSKYGRPTRTTLLRARQRCNSAPINMSQTRKELQKQIEDSCTRRSVTTPTVTDLLKPGRDQRESVYSFLIGARYNRAHCLDARSAEDFGVYMPRNNPLGCFIVDDKRQRQGSDGVPDTPPADSKSSLKSHDDTPIISKGFYDLGEVGIPGDMMTSAQEDVTSRSPSKQDCDENHDVLDVTSDSELIECDSPVSQSDAEEETRDLPTRSHKQAWSDRHAGSRPVSAARRSVPLMQQIINLDDGFSVSGKGVANRGGRKSSSRPASALPPSSVHRTRTNRPSSAPKSTRPAPSRQRDPPFVLIQGKSMSSAKARGFTGSRDSIGYPRSRPLSANQVSIPSEPIISDPPPTPSAPDSARRFPSSPRDPSPRLRPERPKTSTSRPKSSRHRARLERTESFDIHENTQDRENDRISIDEDTEGINESSEFDRVMEEFKAHQEEPEIIRSQILSEAISEAEDSELLETRSQREKRRSRVRFADELEEVQKTMDEVSLQDPAESSTVTQTGGQGDSDVMFFLTEEEKGEGHTEGSGEVAMEDANIQESQVSETSAKEDSAEEASNKEQCAVEAARTTEDVSDEVIVEEANDDKVTR